MHILWINEFNSSHEEIEKSMFESVAYLRTLGFRSSLVYSSDEAIVPSVARVFDRAIPMVELDSQIESLCPDVICVRRLGDLKALEALATCSIPVARFFHEQEPFAAAELPGDSGAFNPNSSSSSATVSASKFTVDAGNKHGLGKMSAGEKEQKINRTFDAFVVPSDHMRDKIMALGFDPNRIKINPLIAGSQNAERFPCDTVAPIGSDPNRYQLVRLLCSLASKYICN